MLLASIALVIGIVPAWFVPNSVLYESTDDAQIDGHIMRLSTRINGQVEQVKAVEGQLVHAGDVLAVIEPTEYKIAVCRALARLADAENNAASLYLTAAITTTTAYGGLNSAQAAVKNAAGEGEAANNLLQADQAVLERVIAQDGPQQLVEATVAQDQQELLQVQGKLQQARADLRTAQTAPQQVSLAEAQAHAADSQILQGKAELEQAQLNLTSTIIRSPVTAIVGKRRVEIGQNVTAGQEVIDIVSLDDVWITANFKETQLGHLGPGQPVDIKVDAYGRTWKGHVTSPCGGAGSVFSTIPLKNASGNRMKVVQRVPVRIDFDRSQD
jgi:membrane fusion protein (multidrug efflux system)